MHETASPRRYALAGAWNVVIYFLVEEKGCFIGPATSDIADCVATATKNLTKKINTVDIVRGLTVNINPRPREQAHVTTHQRRDTETLDEANAFSVSVQRKVKASNPKYKNKS